MILQGGLLEQLGEPINTKKLADDGNPENSTRGRCMHDRMYFLIFLVL